MTKHEPIRQPGGRPHRTELAYRERSR